MAVFAIGDIQGCHDSLLRLLDRIRYTPNDDTLWFCGDLVNRGAGSLETLRFVRGLDAGAITVLGNHDLHLVAAARDPALLRPTDTLDAVLAADDAPELIDWLRCRPLLHHDAELGYTMVHAGLPPAWDLATASRCAREVEALLAGPEVDVLLQQMYGDEPTEWDESLVGTDRIRYIVNALTRLRYVTRDGRLALAHKGAPGTQPEDCVPWFEHPDRLHKGLHIVFGHWSTLQRQPGQGVYPLDTGCVWGGQLTALRLDGDGSWYSVPCSG
ncbi:MAG: symmetrical bis(5'-nucleosyl)-tetraphosphatase [Xanthomonadaceae bacterium]|nr:symmetrical bis(5'-nucleosyl)-tetraphosphatase [Xanthomonadaceae bacterium]